MYHTRTFICRQNCPSINVIHSGINTNSNYCKERFSCFDILIKYQYLTSITVNHRGDFLGTSGQNPSVSKSDQSRVVIFRFFFVNMRYVP